MSTNKPVIEVRITDVDSVWIEPGIHGGLRLLLCTDGEQELALRLRPEVLAKLEAKLAAAREAQARMTGRQ